MGRWISVMVFLACGSAVKAQEQDLGVKDLRQMHATYEANQARFMKTYRDRRFKGVVRVYTVEENQFERGQFAVDFSYKAANLFGGEVRCPFIRDKKTIDQITDLNKGDRVSVEGTIEDHAFGKVVLKDCTFAKM